MSSAVLRHHPWRATLIGGVAVLMWSSLALMTAWSGRVPPFQLVAMSFSVVAVLAVLKWVIRGENIITHLRQPPAAWALGIGGLFGYHFLYFLAIRNAPTVEANLINYLWPLLIVLFSAFLPGERLLFRHVLGALAGLMGTVVLLYSDSAPNWGGGTMLGYGAAVGCGIVWSGYSVLNRRFVAVPTDAVGGFVAVAALLSLACHLIFEQTVWPADLGQWLAVLALGLGPAGGAFFFWDFGVKHGHIRVLGAWAYGAPLMSTLLLLVFGLGTPSFALALACMLIVGGAVLASLGPKG